MNAHYGKSGGGMEKSGGAGGGWLLRKGAKEAKGHGKAQRANHVLHGWTRIEEKSKRGHATSATLEKRKDSVTNLSAVAPPLPP